MRVLQPRRASEAVRVFAKEPEAIPLAGGTDLMVAWNAGRLNGRTVLDVTGVKEWRRIQATRSSLVIGALVTHAELQEHAAVRKAFPLLVEACATVGGVQIQNRGTLAGNVANASPAGDSFPPLAVYEAVVRVVSAQGRRKIPFARVFAGVKKTTLQPGELIEAIELPFLEKKPTRQVFRKVGTRAAQAISKTMVAGLLWLGRGRRVEEARFALGSVATTVRRLSHAEQFLGGKTLTTEVVEEASALVAQDVSPIDDLRSTAEYRMQVARNLLSRFLSEA